MKTEKACTKCAVVKPLTAFYSRQGTGMSTQSSCKACWKNLARLRYHADPLAKSATTRRCRLRRVYGLTLEAFDDMMLDCGGLCSVCRGPLLPPCVDHCHTTGRVRGLLCQRCNKGLGNFTDSPSVLRAAADYLEKQNPPFEFSSVPEMGLHW